MKLNGVQVTPPRFIQDYLSFKGLINWFYLENSVLPSHFRILSVYFIIWL